MKRRAFALGIVAAGSSLGGVIFPIMLDHLIPEVGYGWALRISAFLILALLVFGNLTVRSRFAPSPKPLKLYQYLKPLTETPYLLTTIASFLFYLGLFLPINYIQVQSTEYGMSTHLASYMIPILNAARYVCPLIPCCALIDALLVFSDVLFQAGLETSWVVTILRSLCASSPASLYLLCGSPPRPIRP